MPIPAGLMLAGDAWMAALYEDGPESLVTIICERAYATGSDLVDLAGLRQSVTDGRGPDILAAMPTVPPYSRAELLDAFRGIAEALGADCSGWSKA